MTCSYASTDPAEVSACGCPSTTRPHRSHLWEPGGSRCQPRRAASGVCAARAGLALPGTSPLRKAHNVLPPSHSSPKPSHHGWTSGSLSLLLSVFQQSVRCTDIPSIHAAGRTLKGSFKKLHLCPPPVPISSTIHLFSPTAGELSG